MMEVIIKNNRTGQIHICNCGAVQRLKKENIQYVEKANLESENICQKCVKQAYLEQKEQEKLNRELNKLGTFGGVNK